MGGAIVEGPFEFNHDLTVELSCVTEEHGYLQLLRLCRCSKCPVQLMIHIADNRKRAIGRIVSGVFLGIVEIIGHGRLDTRA